MKGGSASHAQKSKAANIATRLIHVVIETNFDELLLCNLTQPLAALNRQNLYSIIVVSWLGQHKQNQLGQRREDSFILEQEPTKARSAGLKLGY